MANQDYRRLPGRGKFAYFGVDFHHPCDLMPPNRAPYLLNVTPNVLEGTLRTRPGCTLLGDTGSGLPIHSMKRLNNELPGSAYPYARFFGSGFGLYAGSGGPAFPLLEAGYSGNPLSLVPFRPLQSPEPWLYVFDSLQQRKYKTDLLTKRNVGIAVPTVAPTTTLDVPLYKLLQDAAVSGTWVGTGDAAAPSTADRVPTGAITAAAVVYDTGATGWADVALTGSTTGYGWLGLGMRITVDAEATTVEQVFTGTGSTTVAAVAYDSGLSGPCVIQPVLPQQGLVRNQLVKIGTQYVRVLSVTAGPDGSYSFEANVAATVNVGDAIDFVPGFRAYFTANHVATATVSGDANTSALTFSTGVAQVALDSLSIDCTKAGTPPRSLVAEDYMHVSFWTDHPENIIEIHILLDVDAATNDFSLNYYYYVSRQGDFTQIVSGGSATLPALLTSITSDIADSFDASAESTNTGQSPYPVAATGESGTPSGSAQLPAVQSWFEATFKLNDLIRVGSDKNVGLNNVKAIGIKVFLTGNCNIEWGSWWAGGGYGPDSNFNSYGNGGIPIQYRYRYRASETGAVSDVSPESRNGDLPRRQRELVSVTASPDPQVDLIDIERFGGSNAARGWKQVLTVPNTTGTYDDDMEEGRAEGSEALPLLQYVPWPVTDKPRTGTCDIVGTRVQWVSGDPFDTRWTRGTEFIVNNQTYSLYAPPSATSRLDLAQNVGLVNSVKFIIPEATIAGFPLPYCWESKGNDRVMACGDPYNPGRLYFSQQGSPDTASDAGYIEVTDPSEPLLGGGHYEGADYVFTDQGVHRVDPTTGPNVFVPHKLSLTFGMAGPWAFVTNLNAPYIFFMSTTGVIYAYNPAGPAEPISDDLKPLLPHEGQPGETIYLPYIFPGTGGYSVYPPDFSRSQYMRFEFVNNQLCFDYVNTAGVWNTVVFDMRTKGWILHFYNPPMSLRYQEDGIGNPLTLLGADNGEIYYVSNSCFDGATVITSIVVTPADDQGDTRALKQYGDVMFDFQGLVGVQPYYKNLQESPVPGTYTLGQQYPRGQWIIPIDSTGDGSDTSWQRNIGLVITWFSARPV